MGKRALDGIRILDFFWGAAGPVATRHLADHGAQVIRVESNYKPDWLRNVPPFKDGLPGIDRSGYYANFNSSKLNITLNLHLPKGVAVARRLVAISDVVCESFTPRAMKKWDLTYEDLKAVKPDIIMISMPQQGKTGPHAEFLGYGNNLQALCGINHMTGWPDREPVGTGVAYTDFSGPYFAGTVILAALDFRRRTGKGQQIDLSQLEAGVHCIGTAVLDCAANGREQARMGNRDPRAAPHGAYRCRGDDRWCVIAVFTDRDWQGFCKAIGHPTWTGDEKFSTQHARKRNEDELDRLVERWTVERTAEEVMGLMQANGVAAGVVQNARDTHGDPHLKHRHHYWFLDHPEMGKCAYDGHSFRLSRTPADLRPAPCLGEHNEYVYTHLLGMSDGEFAELVAEGVFQ